MRSNAYQQMVRDFMVMADRLNRQATYDYARNGGHAGAPEQPTLHLPVDVYATDDAFVVNAYLPGVSPETVEIVFEGEALTIRGGFAPLPAEARLIRSELFHGRFERRITFQVPVDADSIAAEYNNGLLTLRVPKAEVIKPKQIKVQVR